MEAGVILDYFILYADFGNLSVRAIRRARLR